MHAFLDQQGLFKALKDVNIFFKGRDDEEKEDLMEHAIQFCLSDEVLREVVYKTKATRLWKKLKTLYMTKSITN